jgi:hypothetical protein
MGKVILADVYRRGKLPLGNLGRAHFVQEITETV